MNETEARRLRGDPNALFLTYAQIAARTQVPERTVRTWPRQGLRVLKLGRHVRVRADDLDAWLASCAVDGAA